MKYKTQIHIAKEKRHKPEACELKLWEIAHSLVSTNTTDTQQTLNYHAGEIKWPVKAIHKFNSFMAWFLRGLE